MKAHVGSDDQRIVQPRWPAYSNRILRQHGAGVGWGAKRGDRPWGAIVLTAALACGVGPRTNVEAADLLMQETHENMFAEAMSRLGGTATAIPEVAAALWVPLHPNCYLARHSLSRKLDSSPSTDVKVDGRHSLVCRACPAEAPHHCAPPQRRGTSTTRGPLCPLPRSAHSVAAGLSCSA
jgi:hypothetical protein